MEFDLPPFNKRASTGPANYDIAPADGHFDDRPEEFTWNVTGKYHRVSERALATLLATPSLISEFLYPDDEEPSPDEFLDIDKSWHIIHFLLTGKAATSEAPLTNVVMGGTEIPDEDTDEEPVRYLTPSEVREVSRALATISVEQLLSRYNVPAIAAAGIYPGIWDAAPEHREYVSDNYEELCTFFANAARNGDAMFVWRY